MSSNPSSSSSLVSLLCIRCHAHYKPQNLFVKVCSSCAEINCLTAEIAIKRCRDAEQIARAELITPLRKRQRRVFEAQFAEVD